MSLNIVDIYNAANTRLDSILTGYQRLVNVFDIETNPDPPKVKGYAVKWGAANTAAGLTNNVTLDHEMDITIVNSVPVRYEDNKATEVNAIYTDIGTVLTSFMGADKIGIPSKILGILRPSLSDPVVTADGKYVYITITFVVKYREAF